MCAVLPLLGETMPQKSIGYVDDDRDEIGRFLAHMGQRFIIGAGVTVDEAMKALEEKGIAKPDLFLLDLYYGPQTNATQRQQIEIVDRELSVAEARVRDLLVKAGQSPRGGQDLEEEVAHRCPGVPRAFFSRKAFLQDALDAYERGLPLLAKPDPDPNNSMES